MKSTHPKWYPNTKVTCACGNKFTLGSTMPEIQVEACSACHPFYTGQMKYFDTTGRVDAFREKQTKAKKVVYSKTERRKRKRLMKIREELERPETLEELRKLEKKEKKKK
jgi:large subunit ribosomal protein L31